jgi:hypothetical protein
MSPLPGDLEAKARRRVAHLPPGAAHCHIAVISHEMPPDSEDVALSAPYWSHDLAQDDARKFRELIIGIVRGYEVGVMSCDRACPPSSIGNDGEPLSAGT